MFKRGSFACCSIEDFRTVLCDGNLAMDCRLCQSVLVLFILGNCVDSLCSASLETSTGASFFSFSCRTECRSTLPFICNPVGRDGSATECAVSGK